MDTISRAVLRKVHITLTRNSFMCHTNTGTRLWHCTIPIAKSRTLCSGAINLQLLKLEPNKHCSCFRTQHVNFHSSSYYLASKLKNQKRKITKGVKFKPKAMKESGVVAEIYKNMTVQALADTMQKDIDHIYETFLYINGTDHYDQPHSEIDNLLIIKEVVKKSGLKFKMKEKTKTVTKENKDAFRRPAADPSTMVVRPPVVTIMGHVDHGKTTLLDALRNTNVVAKEFGGITQHIGAFTVKQASGEMITFLDTPGHAAFTAMRARGADVTDIVVLVVAADDGVMKQTEQSIQMAKNAQVPIIVAINKIDKPQHDIERAKQELLQHGVILEDFDGDVQSVPISALKGTNLDQLQEAIMALAEMLDLKADPTGYVEGSVIESRTDPGRGKLSTVIISRGTLKKGSAIVAGTSWAKVRGMFDDKGKPVIEAPPSTAVEVIGWKELPSAGDEILQVENEQRAKEVIQWRQEEEKLKKSSGDQIIIQKKMDEHMVEYQKQKQIRLDKGFRRARKVRGQERGKEAIEMHSGPELPIVIKGDVDGSVEAILDALDTYTSDKCRLHLLQYGVGNITEQDVEMASAFGGIVYGFNVQATENVGKLASKKNVKMKRINVIYRLINDIKEELNSRLPTIEVEDILGQANVLQAFLINDGKKKVPVAGCRCVKGILQKRQQFKLVRDGEVLATGALSSLKHFKNEVDSIKTDVECGLSFEDKTAQPQPGDEVICFQMKKEEQTIDWKLDF